MILACGAALYFAAIIHAQNGLVPYPDGYRKWVHVKSAIVEPGSRAFPKWRDTSHICQSEGS